MSVNFQIFGHFLDSKLTGSVTTKFTNALTLGEQRVYEWFTTTQNTKSSLKELIWLFTTISLTWFLKT